MFYENPWRVERNTEGGHRRGTAHRGRDSLRYHRARPREIPARLAERSANGIWSAR